MILVTGATGNVGSEVVSQLTAAGYSARVFVRDPRKAARWRNRVEIAVGDLCDPESFARAAKGVRSVLLIAVGADMVALAALLRATRESGVSRAVFISGSLAEWPDSKIGALFQDREVIVRRSGLRATILRPCDFMTNAYQWIDTIKRERAVYNPLGGAKTALIAPEDVAAVAVKCLTRADSDGQTIKLTGGEALSIPEQVGLLSQVLNQPIRCIDVSVGTAVENLLRIGMSEISARFVGEIYEREQRGQASKTTGDFTRITAREPKTFRAWAQDHSERFAQCLLSGRP